MSKSDELSLEIFLRQDWINPVELANEIGASVETVRTWISDGQLRAVNAASAKSSRPRWRINQSAWLAFARQRANLNSPIPQSRRRAKEVDLSDFFGDDEFA